MANQLTRRNFMVRTIVAVTVFIGGVLAAALGGFGIVPAFKKRASGWSDAGTVADLKVGLPQERRFFEAVKHGWQTEKQERSVWLVRKNDGNVVVFSSSCPHLGCGYRWMQGRNRFECPCHGSLFDINGNVLAGPSPRPLDTIDTKIQNGRLFVKYEVFQLGISRKVTV